MTQKLDKYDIEILSVLTSKRRATLNEMASHFKLKGIEITGEAIRKRLGKLEDLLFLPLLNTSDMESMDIEPMVLLLKIRGGKELKSEILKKIEALKGFLVLNTLGNFDLICFFLVQSSRKINNAQEIIDKLEERGDVETEFLFPTECHLNLNNLFISLSERAEAK